VKIKNINNNGDLDLDLHGGIFSQTLIMKAARNAISAQRKEEKLCWHYKKGGIRGSRQEVACSITAMHS
jgi:hypothetical protein